MLTGSGSEGNLLLQSANEPLAPPSIGSAFGAGAVQTRIGTEIPEGGALSQANN